VCDSQCVCVSQSVFKSLFVCLSECVSSVCLCVPLSVYVLFSDGLEFYFETDWTSILLMFWSLGSHCVFLPVENYVTALKFYAVGKQCLRSCLSMFIL